MTMALIIDDVSEDEKPDDDGIDIQDENYGDLATKQHDADLDDPLTDSILRWWWVPFAGLLGIAFLLLYLSHQYGWS